MSFINIVIQKSGINEDRDIVVDTVLHTANVGLLEDTFEYELYESDNDTQVISVPISKTLNEKQQKIVARRIAHKLFDKGYSDFEIEFGINEAQLNENLLRRGSRGPEVKALQQQLGMPAAEQDGIYGPKTEQAVRNFQTSQGLQVDGIVGPQTRASIANAQAAGTATRDAPYNPQTVPQTPTQRRAPQTRPTQGAAAQAAIDARAQRTQGSDEIQTRVLDKDGNAIEPMPVDDLANMANQAIDSAGTQGGVSQGDQAAGANAQGGGQGGAPSARLDQKGATPPPNPDANDQRAGNTDSGFRAPQGQNLAGLDQRGTAAAGTPTDRLNQKGETPATGQSTQPVQPIGRVSSSRPIGSQPNVRPGDETNALDAMAADAQTLGQTGRTTAPPPENPDANDPRNSAEFDSGARGTPNLPNVTAQTTAPTMSTPQGSGTGPNVSTTQDPTVNQTSPGAPQFPGGERSVNVDTTPASQAAPSVDPKVATGMAGTFYQAMKGGTGIGTNKGQIRGQLERMSNADTFNAAAEAYEREHGVSLFQHFYDEMSDRQIAKFVKPELDRLGIAMPGRDKYESVTARPKGAFMFRERAEWDAKYGKTHNNDGSLKSRNFINESKMQEVTFHDDDEFFEAYGVLWFNEDEVVDEAEYKGRKVKLGKPMAGDVKKFKVYVRNPKGNVVKVNFGQKGAKIKKSNPKRRRSFRARHNCDNPGPRHKARYWSCRKW
jgi:peptidoglycan hydrolase-like protein with peptidoglycan-binding domain